MDKPMLVNKLAKVMQEVKYIEKKGFNSFHKYNYATESDVAEKVREVLASQNVMMIPSVKEHFTREHINAKGKTEYIATVLMEFTFIDGETGEKITFQMAGEGQDAGDKAYYKAITGAQKYALMKAFMIPTGDDPEQDDQVDARNSGEEPPQERKLSQAQVNRLFAIAKSKGFTAGDVKKVIVKDYKKTNAEDLTKQEYDELCNRLENQK